MYMHLPLLNLTRSSNPRCLSVSTGNSAGPKAASPFGAAPSAPRAASSDPFTSSLGYEPSPPIPPQIPPSLSLLHLPTSLTTPPLLNPLESSRRGRIPSAAPSSLAEGRYDEKEPWWAFIKQITPAQIFIVFSFTTIIGLMLATCYVVFLAGGIRINTD